MPASTMQPNLEALDKLTGVRAGALQRWQETGWPDHRAEQWRFTRLSSVEKMDFRPAQNAGAAPGAQAISAILPENAVILSFNNGVLDTADLAGLPTGVSASQLDGNDTALARLADLVPQSHPISDLSLAAMSSGVHLEIIGTVVVPIVLAFTGDDKGLSAHPVVSVRLQDGASAVLAEWHQAGVGLSAPLMAIDVGAKARLDYAKVQQD
jgi:Fe-S cluster assembly protein SufD